MKTLNEYITLKEGYLIFLIAFCSLITLTVRDSLPSALSQADADNNDDFSGLNAYADLKVIASQKHPIYTQANVQVHDYILSKINQSQVIAQRNGHPMIVYSSAVTPDSEMTNLATSHIIAIIPGLTTNALLISAHYDSVYNSYGASDNGAGVSVGIEILRKFASYQSTLQASLIVFFNNGEENGLLGSRWLVQQSLFSNVKWFINLEGGGTGGRSILFRSNDYNLATIYKQYAPYPHMNVVGGDLIGALGSYTDYQTYTEAGSVGLDIAFYETRANYHTSRDNIQNIGSGSVQQMGSNAYKVSQQILLLNPLITSFNPAKFVYYDILDRSPTMYLFTVKYALAGVIVALSIIFIVFKTRTNLSSYLDLLSSFSKHILAIILSFVASLIFSIVPIICNFSYDTGFRIAWSYMGHSFFAVALVTCYACDYQMKKLSINHDFVANSANDIIDMEARANPAENPVVSQELDQKNLPAPDHLEKIHADIWFHALFVLTLWTIIFELIIGMGFSYVFSYLNIFAFAVNIIINIPMLNNYPFWKKWYAEILISFAFPFVYTLWLDFMVSIQRVMAYSTFSIIIPIFCSLFFSYLMMLLLPYLYLLKNRKILVKLILAFQLVFMFSEIIAAIATANLP